MDPLLPIFIYLYIHIIHIYTYAHMYIHIYEYNCFLNGDGTQGLVCQGSSLLQAQTRTVWAKGSGDWSALWTQHGSSTRELSAGMALCKRPMQAEARQNLSMGWGSGNQAPREEESIFFKSVTPGRSAMLLWTAKHLRIWRTKIGLSEIRKKSPPKVQRLGNRGRCERSWGILLYEILKKLINILKHLNHERDSVANTASLTHSLPC